MRAKIVNEIQNFERGGNPLERLRIGKADLLRDKDKLDELSLEELIVLVDGMQLVTREGYYQENKYDFLPNYVEKRIRDEAEQLPNSSHTYDTWDNYSLYKFKDDNSKKAIMYISLNHERGSAFKVKFAKYKEEVYTEYVVDWD
jgi:hypothetical protein